MTDNVQADNVQAAHVSGRYSIAVAVIAALASIIAALITVQKNTTLQQQNDALQKENSTIAEEVSKSEDTISALNSRISDLEKENETLKSDKATLQSNYQAALDEIARLKEASAPEPNAETNVQALDFIQVLQPYESANYHTSNNMKMMGNTYSNGFYLNFDLGGYALFNLEGKYETLEFDMGHIDGSSMVSVSFDVYLDGKFSETIELYPEMRVTHTAIPLDHALTMKITFNPHSGQPKYGFANAKIS